MKFDSRYSTPIRPIFRVLAVVVAIPALLFGLCFFIGGLFADPFEFDGDFKFGISGTLMGLLFLVAGFKGNLPKWLDGGEEEAETENSRNMYSTRKACLISLGGVILTFFIFASIILTTQIFSIPWWLAVAFGLFFWIFSLFRILDYSYQ